MAGPISQRSVSRFGDYLRRSRAAVKSVGFVNTAVYFSSTVLARAGAIFLVPLYTRRLSVAHFGDYALAQTILLLAPSILSLGSIAAVNRFYFDGTDRQAAREKSGGAARCSMLWTFALAIPLQIVIVLFAPASAKLAGRWELSCLLWASVAAYAAAVPLAYLRAAQRPTTVAILQLIQFLLGAGAGVLFVGLWRRDLRGAIEALAVSQIVLGLIGVIYVFGRWPGRVHRAIAKETLSFSFPFVPHLLSNHFAAVADRWVLKVSGQETALGNYVLAGQLTSPVQMGLQAWNEAYAPILGESYRSGGAQALRASLTYQIGMYLGVVILPGLALLLVSPLLGYIVGDKFAPGLVWIPVLLALLAVEALYFPGSNTLYYLKRTRLIPVITGLTAVLAIVLNLLLVPRYGLVGVIIARLVAAIFRSTTMMLGAVRAARVEMEATG